MSHCEAPTLFVAHVVHALSRHELYAGPALLCVRDGRVAWLDTLNSLDDADAAAAARGVDLTQAVRVTEGFLCPGMVDTHTHAPQYPNNGLGHSLQLLEWLDALTFPLEKGYADVAFAEKVYAEVVRRNLAAGTTTACYYGTIHVPASLALARAALSAGQRALVGRCSMDRCCPSDYVEENAETSMHSTHEFLDQFPKDPGALSTVAKVNGVNGGANGVAAGKGSDGAKSDTALVRPILTPRFALSCTPTLLRALGDLAAERSLPIQTHISENVAEIKAVREAFPDIDSYAGVYDHYGLLGPRTILGHGVHLGADEIRLIAERRAGVAHCPTSNINLGSGAARVLSFLDAGVRVALGSDCSGGPGLGILPAIRAADAVARVLAFEGAAPRGLSVPELWYLATRAGADLAHANTGNFAPGREFDALWIRPRSPGMWTRPSDTTMDTFEKWLFAGDDRDIAAVWVRGRCVSGTPPDQALAA